MTVQNYEKDLAKCVMDINEVYNGMTYSQLLREWLVWLFSSSPSYEGYRGETCFLSGNVSYSYDPETGERKQMVPFQNRARTSGDPSFFRGDVVFPDTGIFIPVISAFYSVGERYYGKKIDTLRDCQNICRRDIDEGGDYWCEIQRRGSQDIDLVEKVVRVESPSVYITVTEDSLLKDRFEMPIEAGVFETYCVANVLMIKGLPHYPEDDDMSYYRLHYGGYGRGEYVSDSYVDFIVSSEGRRILGSKETKRVKRKELIDLKPPKMPEGLAKFE